MRILALVSDAFGGHGGIAKNNRDLLLALTSIPGIVEVVAIPRLAAKPLGELPPKLTYLTHGLGGKINYSLAVIKAVMRNLDFDLVICCHINLLPLANLCALASGAPLALMIYGIEAWEAPRHILVKYFARHVRSVISISEITKKRFRQWTRMDDRRIHILPCSVDMSLFGVGPKNFERLRRYGLQDKKVIMTFGRLASEERYKGFDEVLEVLPELARDIPTIAYMIIGDGPDRSRLETKAENLGIRERVVFTGYIPEEEKADHYRLADAYVMPSHGEGFGIVYLEAMACGIPVVASRLDGGRDALKNGELGILTDPDDPQELRNAIRQALKRQRGHVPVGLEYFSFQSFQDRVHALFPLLRLTQV